MHVKWIGEAMCSIKICFIACLLEMAPWTGNKKNITFHFLKKHLNMIHTLPVSMREMRLCSFSKTSF